MYLCESALFDGLSSPLGIERVRTADDEVYNQARCIKRANTRVICPALYRCVPLFPEWVSFSSSLISRCLPDAQYCISRILCRMCCWGHVWGLNFGVIRCKWVVTCCPGSREKWRLRGYEGNQGDEVVMLDYISIMRNSKYWNRFCLSYIFCLISIQKSVCDMLYLKRRRGRWHYPTSGSIIEFKIFSLIFYS